MTDRTEPVLLNTEIKRLQALLRVAVSHFQIGEDAAGIKNLLSAMEELERLVEISQNSWQPQIDLNLLLPSVRRLYFYMKNQDITGITDLLNDTVYPLTEKWIKGCDDT